MVKSCDMFSLPFCIYLFVQEYLKDQIAAYFVKRGEEATIKYLDPSYMIR